MVAMLVLLVSVCPEDTAVTGVARAQQAQEAGGSYPGGAAVGPRVARFAGQGVQHHYQVEGNGHELVGEEEPSEAVNPLANEGCVLRHPASSSLQQLQSMCFATKLVSLRAVTAGHTDMCNACVAALVSTSLLIHAHATYAVDKYLCNYRRTRPLQACCGCNTWWSKG